MKLIKIDLYSGLNAEINPAKISAIMVKKTVMLEDDNNGVAHNLPLDGTERYSILVDGRWFAVKDKKQYNRIRVFALEN